MTDSIKDMYKYSDAMELVTPEEEARMPDFHRRHTIAYIQSSFGAAQAEIDDAEGGKPEWVRRSVHDAVSRVKVVLESPDYPIDKAAFLERVIMQTKKICDFAFKLSSGYAKDDILENIAQLKQMRGQIAQQHAVLEPVGMH